MTNTLTIEETTNEDKMRPVLERLSPTVETQVAEIVAASEIAVEEEVPSRLGLGFSVPMAGVRYYAYI